MAPVKKTNDTADDWGVTQISADRSNAQPGARLPPGTRLNGIFEIDEHLIAGGMGEIYKGHEIESGDPVAIKVLRDDLADDETALALFRREAKALHSLHHQAIVRYHVFSHDPGVRRHYLAMEFVHGERLSDIIQRHPLAYDQVRQLQQQLAAALHEAHRNGIIHRDVSPDNILVPDGDVGRAKIIDFGIARSTRGNDTTIIGSGFAGKYNYVSPEQVGLSGGEVTARSDIYSLGLVLAACLLGEPIDMRGSEFEVVEKRRVVPNLDAVDARFRPLLTQMLQPDPKDRPASMAAVAAWQPTGEASPQSRAAGPGERNASRPGSRAFKRAQPERKSASRGRLAAVALTLLLLFGGGAAVIYLVWPPIDPSERMRRFVNSYDGGECFWINPVTIAEREVELYGLGRDQAPFDEFYSAFRREFHIDSMITVFAIMPEQCPAVTFASRTRSQSSAMRSLDIDIDENRLKSEGILMGSITGAGSGNVDLLHVADEGTVHNLTGTLKSDGSTKRFEVRRLPPNTPGKPQLLIAVASSAPLNALKSPKADKAVTVFARAYDEALEAKQQPRAGMKYLCASLNCYAQ
jgi:serine/threonine-protein kinase